MTRFHAMHHFEPSVHSYSGEDYGFLPLFGQMYEAGKSFASSAAGWVADDVANLASDLGLSPLAPEQAFQAIESQPRMITPPENLSVAYEQAVYFLSQAARVADYQQKHDAEARLAAAANRVQAERTAALASTGIVCGTTGYFCPRGGTTEVLDRAMIDIENSGLGPDEGVRFVSYLKSNKRGAQWNRAFPWLVGAGAIAGGVALWYATHKP